MQVNEFLVSCPVVAVGPPQPESPLQVLAETSLIFFRDISKIFLCGKKPCHDTQPRFDERLLKLRWRNLF